MRDSTEEAVAATNARTLFPRFEWLGLLKPLDRSLRFPSLVYRLVDRELPDLEDALLASRLLVGGSWNCFLSLPLHRERCAILEDLAFPYRHEFRHLETRHGCLLWPRVNLDAYTWLDRPTVVFLRKPLLGFCARLEFRANCIELVETETPRFVADDELSAATDVDDDAPTESTKNNGEKISTATKDQYLAARSFPITRLTATA